MRYYEIIVTPKGATKPKAVWTSYPNGKNDPGALNVQLDLLSGVFATPLSPEYGNSTVSIDGTSLNDLFQAQQYSNMNIVVKGGFTAGLPLANPSQSGVVSQGIILQSFGNWTGTDMNLNFVLNGSGYILKNPGNVVFSWEKGQSLADALANTLNILFPAFPRIIKISSKYATNSNVRHVVRNLNGLSNFIFSLTSIGGETGVSIALLPTNTIYVFDASAQTIPLALAFTDLIGQPKWVGQNAMQFTTQMRADIQVGSLVKMPAGLPYAPGAVTTTIGNNQFNQLKYKVSFQGIFGIQTVRHVGNFRDPDGTAWATIFQAYPKVS